MTARERADQQCQRLADHYRERHRVRPVEWARHPHRAVFELHFTPPEAS